MSTSASTSRSNPNLNPSPDTSFDNLNKTQVYSHIETLLHELHGNITLLIDLEDKNPEHCAVYARDKFDINQPGDIFIHHPPLTRFVAECVASALQWCAVNALTPPEDQDGDGSEGMEGLLARCGKVFLP